MDVFGKDGKKKHQRGSPEVIVEAPVDAGQRYNVRFHGGDETMLRREQIGVLRHYVQDGLGETASSMAGCDLYQCVIYRCMVGSRAYGLDHDESDIDRRGIDLPPSEMHW